MNEEDCKCIRIDGHLEAVNWILWPRAYKQSPGYLSLGDWVTDSHIWLHYVESCDGVLPDDDVLMSTDTRYWSIHDVQRYFFGDMHCEQVLFTYQYPNLRMPSELGSYLWRTNTALKLPSKIYQKQLSCSVGITLQKMEVKQAQMDRLIISDQLIWLDRMDYFKRKSFFQMLQNILRSQDRLQLVSLENLCCERLEGVNLIQKLSCFNSKSLKYLFLWRFFQTNQNPLLINFSYITGSGIYIPRPSTRNSFLRSLAAMSNLRLLALEYSYIADGTGGALITLLHVIKRPHFRLQYASAAKASAVKWGAGTPHCAAWFSFIAAVCVTAYMSRRADTWTRRPGAGSRRPLHTRHSLAARQYYLPRPVPDVNFLHEIEGNYKFGTRGETSFDSVLVNLMRQNHIPELWVHNTFMIVRIRDYDTVRRFLTPSIPLRETHLQLGIDLKRRPRQDSDFSCFIRHIAHFYGSTLVTLSLHQWHFATFPLRRVFELMPRLVRFHYIGRVEDEVDLKRMLMIVSCGVCDKLKHIKIEIQDDEPKRDYWRHVTESLTKEYADIMKLYHINLCIRIYKH